MSIANEEEVALGGWMDLAPHGLDMVAVVTPSGNFFIVIRDRARELAEGQGVVANAESLRNAGFQANATDGKVYARVLTPVTMSEGLLGNIATALPDARPSDFDVTKHFIDLQTPEYQAARRAEALRMIEPDPVVKRAVEILRTEVSRHVSKRGRKDRLSGEVAWRSAVERSVAEAGAEDGRQLRENGAYEKEGVHLAKTVVRASSKGRVSWELSGPAPAKRVPPVYPAPPFQGGEVEDRTRRQSLIDARDNYKGDNSYENKGIGETGMPHVDLSGIGVEIVLERGPGDLFSYVMRAIPGHADDDVMFHGVAKTLKLQGFEVNESPEGTLEARLWVPVDKAGFPMRSPDPVALMSNIGFSTGRDWDVVRLVPFDMARHFRDARPEAEIVLRPVAEDDAFRGARKLDEFEDELQVAPPAMTVWT